MRLRTVCCLSAACLLLAAWRALPQVHPVRAAETASAFVGRQVPEFSLRDARGVEHSWGSLAQGQYVVVAFLGTECPLALLYGPRLQALATEYAPQGVVVVGVDSNQQDSISDLLAYEEEYGLDFPLLKDPGNVLADAWGARRTPEVFVLDADRRIVYHGRVDDQFGVGVKRPAPTRRDLRDALDQLLAGQPVSVAETDLAGCLIGRVQPPAASGDVTYAGQVAAVLNRRCVSCHRPGELAPFSLTNYADAVGWAETMLEVVEAGRMPPWFASPQHGRFANDARLTDDEKQLLRAWVAGGCPEGDPAQTPPTPEFAEGWQIGAPDQIVPIRTEPVPVPAEGPVAYLYFTADPGWTEDKWIAAAEARPDNRAVVHHILVMFKGPDDERVRQANGTLVGYAPGMPPARYPAGSALRVPAGSQLVFQMHYTPNGAPQLDLSSVGFRFVDPASVQYEVDGGAAATNDFIIPPHTDNYEVQSHRTIHEDCRLLTLTPHMHLRGKAFRYEAVYPDGTRETLLDIPRYDFNWQLRYELAEPKLLPTGTQLVCTAHYDNSAGNPANPDPDASITWGDQTWEEMMIGYYTTLPLEPRAAAP